LTPMDVYIQLFNSLILNPSYLNPKLHNMLWINVWRNETAV